MNGNAQTATYPNGTQIHPWGMGLTEASGVCYQLTGPTGHVVLVAQTDRCGGYCTCSAQASMAECGPCVNDAELTPNCPCVGTVPGVYSQCCGLAAYGCPSTQQACDWCASQNHPHFDLDIASFNYLCDTDSGDGSCVRFVRCRRRRRSDVARAETRQGAAGQVHAALGVASRRRRRRRWGPAVRVGPEL